MSRVKSLSKSGNPRKDQASNPVPQTTSIPVPASAVSEEVNDQRHEVKTIDIGRRLVDKEVSLYSSAAEVDKLPSSLPSSYMFNGRDDKGVASASMERERSEVKNFTSDTTINQKMNSYSQNTIDISEKVQKVSPPRRKPKEKSERSTNWLKKDANGPDLSTANSKPQSTGNYSTATIGSRQSEVESSPDGNINAVLEVQQTGISVSSPMFV